MSKLGKPAATASQINMALLWRIAAIQGPFATSPPAGGEDRMQSAVDEMVGLRKLLYDRLVDSTELRRQIA